MPAWMQQQPLQDLPKVRTLLTQQCLHSDVRNRPPHTTQHSTAQPTHRREACEVAAGLTQRLHKIQGGQVAVARGRVGGGPGRLRQQGTHAEEV